MRPDELVNQLFNQLNTLVGPGKKAAEDMNLLNEDVQQKLRTAAQAAFEKLDLVSRDEFDAQQAVLARTREKLEQLEKQIEELEKSLGE